MGKPSDYHLMTVAQKHERTRIDELPDRCPDCHLAVMPTDEESHAERCEGRPAPGPRSRWLRLKEAVAMGLPERAVLKQAEAGKIRTRGERGQKRYLKRDIHKHKANKIRRTRLAEAKRKAMPIAKPIAKQLTAQRSSVQRRAMAKAKDLAAKLSEFIANEGGYTPASRRLDVPVGSLRRAANGETIRKGTKVLIETQLAKVTSP